MTAALIEIIVILLLVLTNGVLAMAEIAVISARRARLQRWAESGNRGARRALELARTPDRFLSTVQIGITLVGILAGAFAGATIAEVLSTQLRRISFLAPYSKAVSLAIVVSLITYLSLVFGELVPKRIGLSNAERVAATLARPMQLLSRIANPLVRMLSLSIRVVVRLLGLPTSQQAPVTREELIIMMEEGEHAGVFEKRESNMVEQVFHMGESRISALMTYRSDITWLDINDSPEEITRKITGTIHSRFPVGRDHLDDIVGIVHTKDLLARSLSGQPLNLQELMYAPLFLPEGATTLKVLEQFRERGIHLAIVIDEFGGTQGLVTTNDVLESIVGAIPELGETFEPEAVQRADGSWLLDGLLPPDELPEELQIKQLPGQQKGYFETLGGFVMTALGHIPSAGDYFEWGGLRFEVMDMDGHRVDKVLIVPCEHDECEDETELAGRVR